MRLPVVGEGHRVPRLGEALWLPVSGSGWALRLQGAAPPQAQAQAQAQEGSGAWKGRSLLHVAFPSAQELQGKAAGRALAWLSHTTLTVYHPCHARAHLLCGHRNL